MAKLTLSDLTSLANETSAISTINANHTLIEAALENTLSRDGTSPNDMDADLDMNGNSILNLPTPTVDTEPATKSYVDDLIEDTALITVTIEKLSATSTTSLAIGTGAKVFTIDSDKYFAAGQYVLAVDDGNSANTMFGTVTSYSGNTLTLDITVTTGSGTIADWTIYVAGARGATGITSYGDTSAVTVDTVATNDYIVFGDVSDSENTNKVTVANLLALFTTAGTETVSGLLELATTVEAAAGTDTARAVTSAGIHAYNNSNIGVGPPQGRLTLTSGTPVTTSNVTGATTVYYTAYVGRRVPIYNGTQWVMADIGGELSQTTADTTKSPAAVTTNSNYDLFVWNDSGTLRCTRGPAWSSATARGTGAGTTELEQVNGIWVNKIAITNGPAAQRGTYVGTIRSDGSSQINDSLGLRHVWNMYNRQKRPLRKAIVTSTWNYSTATWRQANADTANQVSAVFGMNDDTTNLIVNMAAFSSGATGRVVSAGVGLDSTTAPEATYSIRNYGFVSTTDVASLVTQFDGFAGLGYHYFAILELGGGTDTQTWVGTHVDGRGVHGISGWIRS